MKVQEGIKNYKVKDRDYIYNFEGTYQPKLYS